MIDVEPGDLVLETVQKRVLFVTNCFNFRGIECVEAVPAEDETTDDNWMNPLLYRCDEVQKIVSVEEI